MRVGIIDAEVIGRGKHRFPNLASMKISGYHKSLGDEVTLITSYPSFKLSDTQVYKYRQQYDKIYVSKVFPDTCVPYELLTLNITTYGGTGFFYSSANDNPLPYEIEHSTPDYHLYDEWINEQKSLGVSATAFKYYENYYLGFATRGCIRHCKFCINQHCNKVEEASSVSEFVIDKENRNNICLLDDNILAYENWKEIFEELNATGKQFEFKQGFDLRALTEEKAQVLANSNICINNIYFAFDNIKDKEIIIEKLKLWRKYYRKNTNMYVLCGFDENGRYNEEFWARDVESVLERIKICMEFGVFPYIMRYRLYKNAVEPYYGLYIILAGWCNQKATFSKFTLNEYVDIMQEASEKTHNRKKLYAFKRHLMKYAGKHPDLAYEYYDLRYEDVSLYKYEKNVEKIPSTVNLLQPVKKENKKKVTETVSNVQSTYTFCYKDIINTNSTINLSAKLINSIKPNSIDLITLNCKCDILGEEEKSVLKLAPIYLKSNSNILICINNTNYLSSIKDMLNNNDFYLKEIVSFGSYDKKKITKYCLRFTNIKQEHITDNKSISKKFKDRTTMYKELIPQITTPNSNIITFFEKIIFFQYLEDDYLNRNWICLKKKGTLLTTAIHAINLLNINGKQEQLIIANVNTNTKDNSTQVMG